jgi:oligosaccharide translocation protein RFT1
VIITRKKDDPKVSAEFSLVSHVGGLVPRFVYSPIEEVSYNLFAKLSSEKRSHKDTDEESSNFLQTYY